LFVTLSAGCDASIQYKGNVARGDTTTHAFNGSANPQDRAPIAGANVFVNLHTPEPNCSGKNPSDFTTTNVDGAFETKEIVFGGGGDVKVQVCVVKEGFVSLDYRTVFPTTKDPVHAEKYMNVTLAAE
jgi:hypothetical protein